MKKNESKPDQVRFPRSLSYIWEGVLIAKGGVLIARGGGIGSKRGGAYSRSLKENQVDKNIERQTSR